MENELDMEDIESRLYSQVHHLSTEDEQLSNHVEDRPQSVHSNPYTLNNVTKHPTNRYFHKEPLTQPLQSTFIPLDDTNSLQNNISISPTSTDITTEGNLGNQVQNNITVNQYTVPVLLKRGLDEVLSDTFGGRYFTSWAVQNEHLIGKKRKRPKKERNKEKKRRNKKDQKVAGVLIGVNLNGNAQREVNEVICVSDSDDECIIQDVSPANTLFPKKYNEDESSKKPESDDDIIYIPPPPIEVVNVDGDDKEQEIECVHDTSNSPTRADKLLPSSPRSTQKASSAPELSTSNDFLDSTGIENNTQKFNFGLHGSDFNNSQGEFVRPANPVDFCETESSCSTNEFHRDFNNSVKTVVFDEVEFPREDIFLESNLEKFGTYITPRRNGTKEPEDNTVANSENTEKTDVVEIDSSSDSSSESDYEHSKYINRNLKTGGLEASKKLPTLSPMLSNKVTDTPRRISSKKKTATASPTIAALPKKDLSKKKLVVDSSETESDLDKEMLKSELKKLPKKKKSKKKVSASTTDTCPEITVDDPDSSRKRKKKQKSKEDGNNLEKSHGKKKKGTSGTTSEGGENTDECTSQKKKKRKSVHSEVHEIEYLKDVLARKLSVEIAKLGDLDQPRDKKKSSESSNAPNEETISSQKKKKKNSQVVTTPQNDNVEASVSVNQTEESTTHEPPEKSRSRKKKVSSESNSGNEEGIETTQKKKRHRSGSKSSEKENGPSDSEVLTKKKRDQCLESTPVSEPVVEKQKKKKRKSEKEYPEPDDSAGDKEQKMKIISFSELLDQQPQDIADRIEAEVQKKKKKKSSQPADTTVLENANVENTCTLTAKSDNRSTEEKEEITVENKQQPFNDTVLGQMPVNQVESSKADEAQEDNSEELIVVDDIDLDSSNVIVVDEVESSENVEVVMSSDSEYDFKELSDVGKDLALANCVVQGGANDDDSDEFIVVDDDSGGNLANREADRYAVDEEYSRFDVDAIQRTQTDDPEAWKVSYKDRYRAMGKRSGPRCNRCRHFGHVAVKCTEKIFPPNCSLCGNPGHEEPRCPNKICRQCGSKGDYSTSYCWKCFKFRDSICKLCNMEGHIAKTCPDLWRRYHLTTDEGPLHVSREPQLKPKKEQWCSGCAKRGHLVHECRNYISEFPSATPRIVKYQDVLYCDNVQDSVGSPPLPTCSSTIESLPSTFKDTSIVQSHIPPQDVLYCDNVQNIVDSPLPSTATSEGHNAPICSSTIENLPSTSKDTSIVQSHIPPQDVLYCDNVQNIVDSPLPSTATSEGHNAPICSSTIENLPSTSKDTSIVQSHIPAQDVLYCDNVQDNVDSPPASTATSEGHNAPTCSSAIESLPSTSKDTRIIQSHIPAQSSTIPPLMSLNIPEPSSSLIPPLMSLNISEPSSESSIVPSGTTCSIEVPTISEPATKVLNPFSVLAKHKPKILLDKILCKREQRIYKHIIMSLSCNAVRLFLIKELAELENLATEIDPKLLQKKFVKYSSLTKSGTLTLRVIKEKYFWYRRMNMFLFGVHKLKDGHSHFNCLKEFVLDSKIELDENKRKALFSAHSYIFGANCHVGVNYFNVIRKVVRRYDACDV